LVPLVDLLLEPLLDPDVVPVVDELLGAVPEVSEL